MCDQVGPFRSLVQKFGLVGGVNGTDRNAIDLAGQQILDFILLIGDPAGGHDHVDADVQIGLGLKSSFFGNGPKGDAMVT